MEYPEDTPRSHANLNSYDSDVEEMDDQSMARQRRQITTLTDDSTSIKNTPISTPISKRNKNRSSPIKLSVFNDRNINSPLSRLALQNSPTRKPMMNRDELNLRDENIALKTEIKLLKREISKKEDERYRRNRDLEIENQSLKDKLLNLDDSTNDLKLNDKNGGNNNSNNKQPKDSIQICMLQSENIELIDKLKNQTESIKKYKDSLNLWEERHDLLKNQYNELFENFKLQASSFDKLNLKLDELSKQKPPNQGSNVNSDELAKKIALQIINNSPKLVENQNISSSSNKDSSNSTNNNEKVSSNSTINDQTTPETKSNESQHNESPKSSHSQNNQSYFSQNTNSSKINKIELITEIVEAVMNQLKTGSRDSNYASSTTNTTMPIGTSSAKFNSPSPINNKFQKLSQINEVQESSFDSPLSTKPSKVPQKVDNHSLNRNNKATQTSRSPSFHERLNAKGKEIEESASTFSKHSETNKEDSNNSCKQQSTPNQKRNDESIKDKNNLTSNTNDYYTAQTNNNLSKQSTTKSNFINQNKTDESISSTKTTNLNSNSDTMELEKTIELKELDKEEEEDKTQTLNLNSLLHNNKNFENCCNLDNEWTASYMVKSIEYITK
ncbi:uncharacterized protein KGF55_004560 [Candida pseudojiufengensis]|uniref:uncharacterized protein n=1 Tax=Candida pseudojiufengensis TaxID=497109 RepID=UPI0022240899|nr:uncharacterized protein KGF55_004560 [Candida pseudojiufengensis]KAI5960667.1 hypothetical protein KGF55_004560 [Candida pseudojiufengensis]